MKNLFKTFMVLLVLMSSIEITAQETVIDSIYSEKLEESFALDMENIPLYEEFSMREINHILIDFFEITDVATLSPRQKIVLLNDLVIRPEGEMIDHSVDLILFMMGFNQREADRINREIIEVEREKDRIKRELQESNERIDSIDMRIKAIDAELEKAKKRKPRPSSGKTRMG